MILNSNKITKYFNITVLAAVWIFIFYLYRLQIFSYDTGMPHPDNDRPSMNEIEGLIAPVVEGLPKERRVAHYNKKGVVSMHISYENIGLQQKSMILKNIENQQKWQWIENNKNDSVYCYNQFSLTVYEYGKYRDDIDFLSVSVGWSDDSICRKHYYRQLLSSKSSLVDSGALE
ncbi:MULTISPECIES: hypothetical protein [unclassified Moraxella]|uniref:hypothetical protein n=1 Tax=unclassified Moraxella TaxID=2685852 RepID=UPI00359D1D2A